MTPSRTKAGSMHLKPRLITIEEIPEQRLCLAILLEAVNNLQSRNPVIREQALSWFKEKESQYIFSFRRICDWLGINSEIVEDFLRRKTS